MGKKSFNKVTFTRGGLIVEGESQAFLKKVRPLSLGQRFAIMDEASERFRVKQITNNLRGR